MSQIFQLGAVITLQDQMSQGLQSIKKRWDEFKIALGDADKQIVGMEKSMKTFSTGAKLLGVGLAGAYFLKEPLESAKQFDAALGELKAVSGATAEEMKKLKKKAIEAGIATEFDPTQAVQGLTSLASVGMDAQTAIAALDASLNLATASMGKLKIRTFQERK